MKQFYHFYVVLNNVEDIEIIDISQLQQIDDFFNRILSDIKQDVPQEIVDKIVGQIEELL